MKTDASELEGQGPAESIRGHHYLGIFLLSLATLLLELSLTRVLSVALWYHFGFLVISTALLGFGASGVVLALWTNLHGAFPGGLLLIGCFVAAEALPDHVRSDGPHLADRDTH